MLEKVADKASEIIKNIMLIIFGITIMILVALTVYSVVMRYVFNAPVSWIEEVQMILVVWMTFFGECVAILAFGNISISLIVDKFPIYLRRICGLFAYVIEALVLILIMRLGFIRLNMLLNSNQITAVLHIPKYIQYAAVTFSSVVMLVSYGIIGIKKIHQKEEK